MNQFKRIFFFLLCSMIFLLTLAGCSGSETPPPTIEVRIETQVPSTEVENTDSPSNEVESAESQVAESFNEAAGYPAPDADEPSDYPAPENNNQADVIAQSPAIEFDTTDSTMGSVGGILALEIFDDGYVPLEPTRLLLADVILSDQGEPFFIRTNGSSQAAEVFPTGIFIFNNVPPGSYGLMVDLSFTSYPIEDENGDPLTFSVDAGGVVDLGELLAPIPTGSN